MMMMMMIIVQRSRVQVTQHTIIMRTGHVLLLLHLVTAQAHVIPGSIKEQNSPHALGTVDEHGHSIVEETQHAMCKISSKDLEATANATITRQLKGVCTSSHLDTRMNILERTLLLEINNIKNILQQSATLPVQAAPIPKPRSPTNQNNLKSYKHEFSDSSSLQKNVPNVNGRDEEILKYNMTIQRDNTAIKFLYYWRIPGILDELTSSEAIESGDFYFSGNHLYIRTFPNYKHTRQLFIQVIGIEEFQLPHKFSVLDQVNAQLDTVSPLLNCERQINKPQIQCSGYQISHDLLRSRNFIVNNSFVIKLLIFLEI